MTSSLHLSARVQKVRVSPIAAASARAAALVEQGRDILALTSGEPDFDTPQDIKQAAVDALARGETKYTATAGTKSLRSAICTRLKNSHGLDYSPAEVIVTNGAKQAIFEAFAATLDSGDEVILTAPYWPSFPDAVLINDGTPVIVPTQEANDFKLTAQALEHAITPRTRWLVLNSPSNPTGAVYSKAELQELAAVLRRHPQVWVLWDEIYEHIWFTPEKPTHWLAAAPDLAERSLLINGVSKTHAMTGWRIGWAVGPKALIQAMTVVQSQATSGASAIAQAATVFALTAASPDFVHSARASYARRAEFITQALNAVPGLSLRKPQGSFFAYVNCARLIGRQRPDGIRIESDADVVEWLLQAEGVAVVDGSAYGLSPFFRVSFAVSDEILAKACERIARAVSALTLPQEALA